MIAARNMMFGALCSVALGIAPAQAAPITYTLTTTVSGTLGTATFTNAAVTLTMTGDTTGITAGSGSEAGYLFNPVTTTVNIAGVGTATLTDPIVIASTFSALFDGIYAVIVVDNSTNTGILVQQGSLFSGYGLGSFGPVTGEGGPASGKEMPSSFPTNKGNLSFVYASASGTSTFTAVSTATAPTTANVTINLTATSTGNSITNLFNAVETGSAGALGNATLYLTSVQPKSNGAPQVPIQVTAALYFDQIDSIIATFTEDDVNFSSPPSFSLFNGTISGGTGAYTGATGTLTLAFAQSAKSVYTTTGSGSVTVGGTTTALTLTNFQGSAVANAQEYYSSITATGTSIPLGNLTATIKIDNANTPPEPSIGTMTITVNGTDSFNLFFSVLGLGQTIFTFPTTVTGGTGTYAGATGSFQLTFGESSTGEISFQGTGTLTTAAAGAPIITSVTTAFGAPVVAYNTWLQINGTNLAPANTPAAGVVWSNAPSFAKNEMPTELGNISVTVDGLPGYIFFYCSAVTDSSCTSGDQINVLAPLDTNNVPYPVEVIVTNNGVSSAPFTVLNNGLSPTFPLFDATGHVVARHLNFNFLGPTTLFPGSSTPAAPGETIILVLYGLGPPSDPAPTPGSATQSGSLPSPLQCWVSGYPASVLSSALISPGLYQVNLQVPSQVTAGDNPIGCNYQGYPTAPGALIAVQ